MHILHICNTFFEWQLGQKKELPLEEAFSQHPVFLQLQYLPFLYADPEDAVLVTAPPPENFLKKNRALASFHLVQESSFPQYQKIDTWGHSREILTWAQRHQLPYKIPDWKWIETVNSKAFSFNACPIAGGALIENEVELTKWVKKQKDPFVLKTCYGSSGRGHLHLHPDKGIDELKIRDFCKIQFDQELPVIAEPWLYRILDFSTQWEIFSDGKIQKIGVTLCENDAKGRYLSSTVGDSAKLFGNHLRFIIDHEKHVFNALEKIRTGGFFGNVGIDAFVYKREEQFYLHPIVEINARKTMGWTALQIQKKIAPHQCVRISYEKTGSKPGLLPEQIRKKDGSILHFPKNLSITKICD